MLSEEASGWLPGRAEGGGRFAEMIIESRNLFRNGVPGNVTGIMPFQNRFRDSIIISAERPPPSARPGWLGEATGQAIGHLVFYAGNGIAESMQINAVV